MADILKRIKHCPYCGKLFRGECECPYGKHVRMRMDFTDTLRELYSKRFCPFCGERSSRRECGFCGNSFDPDDMFY